MTIHTIQEDNRITLQLDGWLDTLSAPDLGAAIDSIESAAAITLDFDHVEYIASAGLRQVVASYRKAKELDSAFSVVNAGPEVMSIFQLTGLDRKLNITAK